MNDYELLMKALECLEKFGMDGDHEVYKKPTGASGADRYQGMPYGYRLADSTLSEIKWMLHQRKKVIKG